MYTYNSLFHIDTLLQRQRDVSTQQGPAYFVAPRKFTHPAIMIEPPIGVTGPNHLNLR